MRGSWTRLSFYRDDIESAFTSGADGFRFNARGQSFEVDFGRMKLVSVAGKMELNLRRVESAAQLTWTRSKLQLHPAVSGSFSATPIPVATARTWNAKAAPAATASTKSVTPAATTKSTKKAQPAAAAPAPAPVAPAGAVPPRATAAPPALPAAATAAKKAPLPRKGKVKAFFKEQGYGFIVLDDGQEVFFHISCVSELLDDSIRGNDFVEVSVAKGAKPRALQVRVKQRGSIFRQMCANKFCRDKGDRHFEDRCPLKRKHGSCDGDTVSVSTACS